MLTTHAATRSVTVRGLGFRGLVRCSGLASGARRSLRKTPDLLRLRTRAVLHVSHSSVQHKWNRDRQAAEQVPYFARTRPRADNRSGRRRSEEPDLLPTEIRQIREDGRKRRAGESEPGSQRRAVLIHRNRGNPAAARSVSFGPPSWNVGNHRKSVRPRPRRPPPCDDFPRRDRYRRLWSVGRCG